MQLVIETGVSWRLVELVSHCSNDVASPALRAIANIVGGDGAWVQMHIYCQLLPVLGNLLRHPKQSIKHDAVRVVASITAGSPQQVDQVVNDASILPAIIELVVAGEPRARKEAAIVVGNVVNGRPDAVHHVAEPACIRGLCDFLALCDETEDSGDIDVVLGTLENILAATSTWSLAPSRTSGHRAQPGQATARNPVAELISEAGGLSLIEALQGAAVESNRQKARQIITSNAQTFDRGRTAPARGADAGAGAGVRRHELQVTTHAPNCRGDRPQATASTTTV